MRTSAIASSTAKPSANAPRKSAAFCSSCAPGAGVCLLVYEVSGVIAAQAHLELDGSTLDVHPHLQPALVHQRRVDLDPVSLQRRHAVYRESAGKMGRKKARGL